MSTVSEWLSSYQQVAALGESCEREELPPRPGLHRKGRVMVMLALLAWAAFSLPAWVLLQTF